MGLNVAISPKAFELTVSTEALENVNDVFARMRKGGIEGRVVWI